MFGQPDVADGTEKALAAKGSTERVWEVRAHARNSQAPSEVTISCDLEPNTRSSKNRTEGAITREGSRPFALCLSILTASYRHIHTFHTISVYPQQIMPSGPLASPAIASSIQLNGREIFQMEREDKAY
jgi:hypothetical protein